MGRVGRFTISRGNLDSGGHWIGRCKPESSNWGLSAACGRLMRGFAMGIYVSGVGLFVRIRPRPHGVGRSGSWGLATNAEWHFLREERRLPTTALRRLGFTVAPKWIELQVDTLVETTGLTFSGPGLSVESLTESAGA